MHKHSFIFYACFYYIYIEAKILRLIAYAFRFGSMDDKERVRLIKRQIEEVHGLPIGYLDDIVTGYKTVEWNSESNFGGAFALMSPEQKKIFSYEMLRPEYDNRVFFAGEHVSANHAFIQGALYTGMLAANSIAYHAGRR